MQENGRSLVAMCLKLAMRSFTLEPLAYEKTISLVPGNTFSTRESQPVQGYLTYKKTHYPRTLPQAYA